MFDLVTLIVQTVALQRFDVRWLVLVAITWTVSSFVGFEFEANSLLLSCVMGWSLLFGVMRLGF